MAEGVIVGLVLMAAAAFWLVGTSLYNPRPACAVIEWCIDRRARRSGPQPSGPPIEQIAADLRRLMREHERLVRPSQDWQRAHHVRACESALHDRAEEAATALDLPPAAGPDWTRADLAVRLRQLSAAGLVLTESAGLDRL